ncbi:MAG TPA: hypothetical protein ENF40_01615 [Thermoplasmatales archaeon]|nr:hypothetical protein [Thermoplasmatales archaeon]
MKVSPLLIWEVSRKEINELIKTKRFVIFFALYALIFLLFVWLLCYFNPHLTEEHFLGVMKNIHTHPMICIFYAILPIVLSYDLITKERVTKSIYLFLSKPVSREEVVLGKFLGVIIAVLLILLPVLTIGLIIFSAYNGIPYLSDTAKFYLHSLVLLLVCSCYISLSLLFSVLVRSSLTSLILSLLGGWWGLEMVYPLLSMYSLYNKIPSDSWYMKVAFAVSPLNNFRSTLEMLTAGHNNNFPITVEESLVALLIFLIVTLILSLFAFRKKDIV